ncbi:MAG: DNA-3-methyladenine glycosylase I [Gemmatimonadaceae bacterium]
MPNRAGKPAPVAVAASYCDAADHPIHGPYHDREYGFRVTDDAVLFERLMLEINQAGLSWLTILKKRDGFRSAYRGFDIDAVAKFGVRDRARLMRDAGIIRNRLKVNAAVENARRLKAIRESHGSFAAWLDAQHPLSFAEWRKVFKRTFLFTGGEIVREFLVSTGYLAGAHRESCPAYRVALRSGPMWNVRT